MNNRPPIHELDAPRVNQGWENLAHPESGFITFLRTMVSALGGLGAGVSVVGGIVLLFPVILATVGGAATAAIVLAPALLLAAVAGISEYRKSRKAREKEAEKRKELNDQIINMNEQLSEMHANIARALELLERKEGLNLEDLNNDDRDEEKKRLIVATLHAIEGVRMLSGKSDYNESSYETLLEKYKGISNEPYEPSQPSKAIQPEEIGFFRGVYDDTKKFFKGLNERRKEQGFFSAVSKFFSKAWDVATPFLGGFGVGLALGSVAIGVTTLALGTGASFTGIGAIGGVPAIVAGVGLVAAGVGFGLIFAGIKLYAKKRQEKRMKVLTAANETFKQVDGQGLELQNSLGSVRKEDQNALRDERKNIEQEKKALAAERREFEAEKEAFKSGKGGSKGEMPGFPLATEAIEGLEEFGVFADKNKADQPKPEKDNLPKDRPRHDT